MPILFVEEMSDCFEPVNRIKCFFHYFLTSHLSEQSVIKKNGPAVKKPYSPLQDHNKEAHAGNKHILKLEQRRQQPKPGCHISKSPFLAITPSESQTLIKHYVQIASIYSAVNAVF